MQCKSLFVALALVSTTAFASPVPGGLDPGLWERIQTRADRIVEAVAKVNPKLKLDCAKAWTRHKLYRLATVVEVLRRGDYYGDFDEDMDSFASEGDVPTEPAADLVDRERATAPGGAEEQLMKDVDDKCSDDDGGFGGKTMRAVDDWASAHPGWDIDKAYGPQMLPPLHHKSSKQLSKERIGQLLNRQAAIELLLPTAAAWVHAVKSGINLRFVPAPGVPAAIIERLSSYIGQAAAFGDAAVGAATGTVLLGNPENYEPKKLRNNTDPRQGL